MTIFFAKEKKTMENKVLDKLCENIVDVIYQTFTRKHQLVRISQSKTGHIYLIVRKKGVVCCLKKRGRLLFEEKDALRNKIFDVVGSVFGWFCKRHKFLEKIFFLIRNWLRNALVITFIIF